MQVFTVQVRHQHLFSMALQLPVSSRSDRRRAQPGLTTRPPVQEPSPTVNNASPASTVTPQVQSSTQMRALLASSVARAMTERAPTSHPTRVLVPLESAPQETTVQQV